MRIVTAAATAALLLSSGAASAFDWTGGYVGLHGGGAFDDISTYSGMVDGGGNLLLPQSNSFDADGVLLGIQAGYNYQFNNFVVGIEADASWADVSGGDTFEIPLQAHLGTARLETDWFASIRGRLGTSFGPTLLYATGGVTFADYTASVSNILGMGETATKSGTSTGWTIGAGVEHALTNNLTLRAEYAYSRFSDDLRLDHSAYGAASLSHLSLDADVDVHMLRIGVNYFFR